MWYGDSKVRKFNKFENAMAPMIINASFFAVYLIALRSQFMIPGI